jgi:hypothetical protein
MKAENDADVDAFNLKRGPRTFLFGKQIGDVDDGNYDVVFDLAESLDARWRSFRYLRATRDWSRPRLPPAEQVVLRSLGSPVLTQDCEKRWPHGRSVPRTTSCRLLTSLRARVFWRAARLCSPALLGSTAPPGEGSSMVGQGRLAWFYGSQPGACRQSSHLF